MCKSQKRTTNFIWECIGFHPLSLINGRAQTVINIRCVHLLYVLVPNSAWDWSQVVFKRRSGEEWENTILSQTAKHEEYSLVVKLFPMQSVYKSSFAALLHLRHNYKRLYFPLGSSPCCTLIRVFIQCIIIMILLSKSTIVLEGFQVLTLISRLFFFSGFYKANDLYVYRMIFKY